MFLHLTFPYLSPVWIVSWENTFRTCCGYFIGLIQSQRPNCGYLELFWMKGPQMVGLKVALRGIRSNMTPLTSFFFSKTKTPPPYSHTNCILRIFCFYTCTGKSPNAILFVGCINDICLDLLLRLHYVWWFQKKSTHCTATGRRRRKRELSTEQETKGRSFNWSIQRLGFDHCW